MIDTIYAPLTPITYAPVIVIRISGKSALNTLMLFDKKNIIPRKATKLKYISQNNSMITDEVIAIYYKSPASYTGEDILEISFHGNPLIVNNFIKDLTLLGFRYAENGEFSKRAVINQKFSLLQAEAVNSLIHAKTENGIKMSADRLSGDLDLEFKEIQSRLIDVFADVQAMIDFNDDDNYDITIIYKSIDIIKDKLEELINSYKSASIAINGVTVSILGEPNAGKSSLFNKLIKKNRSIVSEEPGTTRDIIKENIVQSGINIILTDTAGIRDTSSVAEKEGIKRALDSIYDSDIIIRVRDLSKPDENRLELDEYRIKNKIVINVGSKLDIKKFSYKTDVNISSLTDEGIKKLIELINESASHILSRQDSKNTLLSQRQYLLCLKAFEELNNPLELEINPDMMAYHLRNALNILNELNGDLTEETLDIIFSKFCVGK